jgi:hypothetical protein
MIPTAGHSLAQAACKLRAKRIQRPAEGWNSAGYRWSEPGRHTRDSGIVPVERPGRTRLPGELRARNFAGKNNNLKPQSGKKTARKGADTRRLRDLRVVTRYGHLRRICRAQWRTNILQTNTRMRFADWYACGRGMKFASRRMLCWPSAWHCAIANRVCHGHKPDAGRRAKRKMA